MFFNEKTNLSRITCCVCYCSFIAISHFVFMAAPCWPAEICIDSVCSIAVLVLLSTPGNY